MKRELETFPKRHDIAKWKLNRRHSHQNSFGRKRAAAVEVY